MSMSSVAADDADEGEYVEPNPKTLDSQSRPDAEMIPMSPAASNDPVKDDYDDPRHDESRTTNSQSNAEDAAIPEASAAATSDDAEAFDDAYENTNAGIGGDHGYINVEHPSAHDSIDYEVVQGPLYLSLEDDPETPPAYENVTPNFSQLPAE